MNYLNVIDEYPVENFHSILRAVMRNEDDAELVCKKARPVDSNKATSLNFSSVFVTPKKNILNRNSLEQLKIRGAEFIITMLDDIRSNRNQAHQVERPKRKQKSMTYWKLPTLYGEKTVVLSNILPLGFQFPGKEPNPNKKCDFVNCQVKSNSFKILHGCGHSFHVECFPSGPNICCVCKDSPMDAIKSLAGKASESILNPESMKAAADKESIEKVEEADDDVAEFPVPDDLGHIVDEHDPLTALFLPRGGGR